MQVNQTYTDSYTNFNWDKEDFSTLENQYSNDIDQRIEKTCNLVLDSELSADQMKGVMGLDLLKMCTVIAQSIDQKYNTSIPNLIKNASAVDKFLMTKLIEKVSQKSKSNKIEIVALCLFFGMKEVNTISQTSEMQLEVKKLSVEEDIELTTSKLNALLIKNGLPPTNSPHSQSK